MRVCFKEIEKTVWLSSPWTNPVQISHSPRTNRRLPSAERRSMAEKHTQTLVRNKCVQLAWVKVLLEEESQHHESMTSRLQLTGKNLSTDTERSPEFLKTQSSAKKQFSFPFNKILVLIFLKVHLSVPLSACSSPLSLLSLVDDKFSGISSVVCAETTDRTLRNALELEACPAFLNAAWCKWTQSCLWVSDWTQ